ncbi:hypothetical protein ACLOJK_037512 [Asimina triloba]
MSPPFIYKEVVAGRVPSRCLRPATWPLQPSYQRRGVTIGCSGGEEVGLDQGPARITAPYPS